MIDAAATRAVLTWGRANLRDLPWRRERDPWRILVAEVMLQQTQVGRVIPKRAAFLDAFPTPAACAAAALADVLRLWQGLGYPRRAKHLHDAARLVVERHGGTMPDDLDALLALPGVGAYTARAVLAFAFEHDVGVVDTNIARLIARVGGERLGAVQAQRVADAAVPAGHGWCWNQTLMDLGATVCRPTPDCAVCPLASVCTWHRAGSPEPDPSVGSAGVSRRQAPYGGSRRQARGDVLRAVHDGPRPLGDFDLSILDELAADGLVIVDVGTVQLAR